MDVCNGDEINLTLSEDSSTGYTWFLTNHNETELQLISADANNTYTDSIGGFAPQRNVINIVLNAASPTVLSLSGVYKRSWERTTPAKQFRLLINVVPACKLYVVRLWDGMDGCWIDISGSVTHSEAIKVWNEHTNNGKEKTKYDDIDYFDIFPADTKMVFDTSNEMFRD